MSHIIVGGEKFSINAPIVLWNDVGGKSFYKTNKSFLPRDWNLSQCQEKLDMFVLHHSVTYNAETCFNVLVSRGLSVNFIIDDDNCNGFATIYQCLDVKDGGYSQKGFNHRGAGVEVCYLPMVNDNPNAYSEINQKKFGVQSHKIVEEIIHRSRMKIFAPTQYQVNSVIALCKAMKKALPTIDWQFQKDPKGNILKNVLNNPMGLSCHYHLTNDKIDPAGMPLEEIDNALCGKDEDIYDN